MRFPVMSQSLRLARAIAPQAIKEIIDVGVQVKTDFLMAVFPDIHHHLFEPSPVYHAKLEDNYRAAGIDYNLHKIALSDVDGILHLHETSVDGSGRITHTQIRPERDESMPFLVGIKEIPTRRLDSVFAQQPPADLSYLVKLDVDGVEEQIIAGGQQVLRNASFIIIETSIGRQDLCRRAALLEQLGFRLFDLCDNAYYYGQLALVDLLLINNRLRAAELKFRPWEYSKGKVHWPKWQHGFKHLEDATVDDPFT
jgi:FkbM family methyltransferase